NDNVALLQVALGRRRNGTSAKQPQQLRRDGARQKAPVRTMAGDLGEFVEARQRRINRDVLAEALRKRRRDGLHSRIVWHKPAPPLDPGIPPQRAEPYKMAAQSAPAQSLDKITFFKIG